MPVDTGLLNYLSRQFTPPDPQELEQNRQANALARIKTQQAQQLQSAQQNPATTPEQFARAGAPQIAQGINQSQDDQIKRRDNARAFLGQAFEHVTDKASGAQLVQSPIFREAATAAGLNPDQFTVKPEDTDEVISKQAATWAGFLRGSGRDRVQSTQIGTDGTVWEIMSDGSTRKAAGVNAEKFAPRATTVAGGKVVFDPNSRGVSGQLSTPQQERAAAAATAGATAGAKTTATQQAENAVALPDALADIDKMRDGVKQLMSAPGFDTIYGMAGVADPRNYTPGTDAANARAMRDTMDAQAFGISIQKMRGLGSLSNAEGSKVTSAFTRATNPKISAEEAKKAWTEVLFYLNIAERKARTKAGQGGQPTAPPPPEQSDNNDPLGIR